MKETVPLPVPSTKNIMSCICRWKIIILLFLYLFDYYLGFCFLKTNVLQPVCQFLHTSNIQFKICGKKAAQNAFQETNLNNTLFSILLLIPRKIDLPVSLTTAYSQRVFNVLQRTRLSRRRMIWLLRHYLPPPSGSCLSLPVFLCVAGRAYWRERGGGRMGRIIRRQESLVFYK